MHWWRGKKESVLEGDPCRVAWPGPGYSKSCHSQDPGWDSEAQYVSLDKQNITQVGEPQRIACILTLISQNFYAGWTWQSTPHQTASWSWQMLASITPILVEAIVEARYCLVDHAPWWPPFAEEAMTVKLTTEQMVFQIGTKCPPTFPGSGLSLEICQVLVPNKV